MEGDTARDKVLHRTDSFGLTKFTKRKTNVLR